MWEYAQINIFLTLAAWATLIALRSVPSRIKFYICTISILFWIVPWQFFQVKLPYEWVRPIQQIKILDIRELGIFPGSEVNPTDLYRFRDGRQQFGYETVKEAVTVDQISETSNWSWPSWSMTGLLFCLLAWGVILAVFEIISYWVITRSWLARSESQTHLVKAYEGFTKQSVDIRYIHGIGPGLTTGLFRPIVWLNPKLQHDAHLKAVLVHELTHIKHHDIFWTWCINILSRLFWWNPVVWFWARKAKHYMEFSCDEAAKQHMAPKQYAASLTELLLAFDKKQEHKLSLSVGMNAIMHIDVQRVMALKFHKNAAVVHYLILGAALCLMTWLTLALAYDGRVSRYLEGTATVTLQRGDDGEGRVEITEDSMPLSNFIELVHSGQYDQAEQQFKIIKEWLLDQEREPRARGFQVLSVYLGDMNRYEDIIALHAELLFDDRTVRHNWRSKRLLALAYLKVGQPEKTLETLGSGTRTNHFDYPTSVLEAQSLHLLGRYEHSNEVIERTLEYPTVTYYYFHRITLLRLKGKNSLLLGDYEQMAQVRDLLGEWAPADFADVKADGQRVYSTHPIYRVVNGVRIHGFEEGAYPISYHALRSANAGTQAVLDAAGDLIEDRQFVKARNFLAQRFAQIKTELDATDTRLFLQALFFTALHSDAQVPLEKYALALTRLAYVPKAYLVRCYWILSIGKRAIRPKSEHYFEKYLSLIGQPTIAADHEYLEYHFFHDDPTPFVPALERIMAFYERERVVPDVRTLNKIMEMLNKLGRQEELWEYRRLFYKHYPRALDFALDDWSLLGAG